MTNKIFRMACMAGIAAVCMGVASCGPKTVTAELGDGLYSISRGEVSMTIDAGKGAKILSYSYAGKEVISQLAFFNAFGSTFWTSPQSEWNWPPVAEYDRMPYEVSMDESSLTMTGQVSKRYGYSISKHFAFNGKALEISYTITNHTDSLRRVAPWEITRVPAEGTVFFECPSSGIWPAGLMDFRDEGGYARYDIDEASENRKVNADGTGFLVYVNNGLKMTKVFDDITPEQAAPGEAEIQVYVNHGKTFVELESQGAYTALGPGESLTYKVKWLLAPCEG